MIAPQKLKLGDTVTLLSCSGALSDTHMNGVERAVVMLEGWGLNVRVTTAIDKPHPYLAGTDSHRAKAFQEACMDNDVRALLFTRGGYGAARFLRYLDPALIQNHCKIVLGYSDVTTLLLYLQKVWSSVVYHGPNLANPKLFHSQEGLDTQASLRAHLFGPAKPEIHTLSVMQTGKGKGIVVGGNLTNLCSSIGTPFEIETDGRILFVEDVGKSPHQIDRMLTHLRNAGKFKNLAGIVFGEMEGCNAAGNLWPLLTELLRDEKYPILHGLRSGHGQTCLTIPLGLGGLISEGGQFSV